MKSHSQIERKKLVDKMNIDNFIKTHGIAYPDARCRKVKIGKKFKKIWIVPKRGERKGNTMFVTMTFETAIYSKKKAEKLKADFVKKLKRYTPFKYCCVPEHHESDAYHFHFLVALDDKNISINDFISRYRKLKFVGWIDAEWTYGDITSVAYYLTQYLTAENLEKIKGKSVTYSKGVLRVANSRCSWVKSQWRRDWRCLPALVGCSENTLKRFYNDIFCRERIVRVHILELYHDKKYDEIADYIRHYLKRMIHENSFIPFIKNKASIIDEKATCLASALAPLPVAFHQGLFDFNIS